MKDAREMYPQADDGYFCVTDYTVPSGKVLVLRANRADMTSHSGFVWPRSGPVEAPDWRATAECCNGLHGWLWGAGEIGASSGAHESADAVYLVVETDADGVIDLNGKVKFRRGVVVFAGARADAVALIAKHAPSGTAVLWGTSTSGVRGTSTSGDGGTSTSGVRGTSTSGYGGTSTSGDGGTSTSGVRGTSTSGVRGTSTSGDGGTSTSGYGGTSTSGYGGTAIAGLYGCICIEWWDAARGAYRKAVAEVDGEQIKPGVAYVVRDGKLAAK